MIKNLIALTLAAVVALSGTTDAAPLPSFARSRKVHRLGSQAGAKALGHLGRTMGKLRDASSKLSGTKSHPFPAVNAVMARGAKRSSRFRARQDDGPVPPQACMAKMMAADACAGLQDGSFEALMENGAFASAEAKQKFCVTDKCQVKVFDFLKCWKDNGKKEDNTELPADSRVLFAIDLCGGAGLEFALRIPQACAASLGTCDKGVVADILNAGDLPIVRGDLDKFCKDDCFSKSPALFDCLVTEGIMDAADKPTQEETAKAKNFMCARGKGDGKLCYNGLRALVKSKCFEDFPEDMENEANLAAWMDSKQASFCQRKCGTIANRALICLAEAKATFPGESSPVKMDKADAAFTDLLCLREGNGDNGRFCLKDLASLEKAAEKSVDTLTEADLSGICGTCTKRVIQALATAEVDGIKEHAGVFGVMCIQDEGKFCLPQLPKAYKDEVFGENDPNASGNSGQAQADEDAPSKEILDAVCTTRCARRFTYRLIELDEALDNESGSTSTSEEEKKKRRAKARAEVEFFCFKNTAGSYCATLEDSGFEKATCPAIKAIGESEAYPFESGTDININTNTCSTACKTEVTKFGTDLGCCFGLYMDQLETMIISDEDFSDDPNSEERKFLTKFLSNLRAGFKLCGADADTGDLMSCAKPRGTDKAIIKIKTSIPASVANGSAKGKLSAAIRKDVCTPSMGNEDLMKNCVVTGTNNIPATKIEADGTVTAAGSTSRRLAALQTADSNTEYVIEFQGKDDAATAKFKTTYNTAIASNDIAPLATSAALQKETGSSLQTANFDQSQREASPTPTATTVANSTASAVVVSTGAVTLAVLASLA